MGERTAMGESNATTAAGTTDGGQKGGERADSVPRPSNELPADVRAKLRKLETLESKYKGVLLLKRAILPG
jgi:hypothetical protein